MMELKAYAKINWDLHVLGKRADGFHELDMVMVNVSLYDTLTFELASTIKLTCDDATLPTDARNLVFKAAALLAQTSGVKQGCHIHLVKNIPAGGGMGGGSSDAACALIGLNRLWNLNWPIERLHPLAAQLGSDIAFFLYGGWRRCLGRGEIVEPLQGSERWPAVPLFLILPPLQVSTPMAYKVLGAAPLDRNSAARNLTLLAQHLKLMLDNKHKGPVLRNDLTQAAQKVEPELKRLQSVLEREFPGQWLMSGSGAVHFVVPPRSADPEALRAAIAKETGLGVRVITATTVTP